VRAECNYKVGIESEVDGESSEMMRRHLSSVAFYDSMEHYKAPQGQHRESLGLLCCAGVERRGIDMYPGTGKT
jgi:hypothetical protein